MVLVSHPAKFIYMKTRKTAGTTVEMYFERFCAPPDAWTGTEAVRETVSAVGVIGSRRTGKRDGDVWYNHMPAREVKALVGDDVWHRYLKFAAVRNPYATVLSSFFWKNDRDYPESDSAFEKARRDFARFVRGRPMRGRSWGNDAEVVGCDGAMEMDMLVRQERLAHDTEAVCERLGLPWNPDWLGHTKKKATAASQAYPLKDFYTAETAAVVRREFDWVFSRLDYGLPQ